MIKNVLKGFIIGVAKIIPGVSGAILAISLGVYDKAILAITNFFDNKKDNFKLLLSLAVGIILAIILFSKVVNFALSNFYLITMLFFIGLIIGGLPSIFREVKKKDSYIVIISFLLVFIISISYISNSYVIQNNFNDIIIFFIAGVFEAIGTIVPGISSTAILTVLGMYELIIDMISNLTNVSYLIDNLRVIISFSLGLAIGIVLISMLMNVLFKKYSNKTYAFILGVVLASVILIIIKTLSYGITFINLSVGIIFLILGLFISRKLDK